ncbi:MAG: lectin-like protein [Candidatus Poribacteria bacterium]|nr:lectin-like protein [Candidatus Poribacteria bacterium]
MKNIHSMNFLIHLVQCRVSVITILVITLSFILAFTSNIHAQDNLSSLSGRVIDKDGKPIPDLKLAVKPVKISRGFEMGLLAPVSSWQTAVTDKDGHFTITDIMPVTSRLIVYPEHGSGYGISSLKFGDITIFSTAFRRSAPTWFGKPKIGIAPGEHLENVVVSVIKKPRHISGQVLLEDGTPLRNTEIYLTIKRRRIKRDFFFFSSGGGGGSSSRDVTTDAEGYFVSYAIGNDPEGSVVVKYEGITAKTKWFKVKKGQSKENLILRLRGLEKHLINQTERVRARQAMWIGNPENNHAYKQIACKSWEDAKAKAEEENAYLVAINDEAEQKWIESTFNERKFYWIGLHLPTKGNAWKWHSGEPLTYTNWGPSGKPDNQLNSSKEIPIALIFSTKKWMTIDQTNPIKQIVKHAILEKDVY